MIKFFSIIVQIIFLIIIVLFVVNKSFIVSFEIKDFIFSVQSSYIFISILVFLFLGLGLMSMSMLVTLPFTLLLIDYWPLGRLKFNQEKDGNKVFKKNTTKRTEILLLVLEKIPLFFLTFGFSILTIITQKTFRDNGNYTELLPFSERLINSIVSYIEYLSHEVLALISSNLFSYLLKNLKKKEV